jgi:hypothetical protein
MNNLLDLKNFTGSAAGVKPPARPGRFRGAGEHNGQRTMPDEVGGNHDGG